ncbi:MAG: hypothetical protein BWY82_00382 [Verrucomicrobia bacterium ADurb.Bin474]|nr:MAG: hypothetical protein BWY82_00382 [Verrucomicrobia bacterium ADurb.Bin474]
MVFLLAIDPWHETIGGLKVESLTLAFLFVNGYSLLGAGLNSLHPIKVVDATFFLQGRTAMFADVGQGLRGGGIITEMPVAAG